MHLGDFLEVRVFFYIDLNLRKIRRGPLTERTS